MHFTTSERLTAQQARERVLRQRVRDRRDGGENRRGVRADAHGDREPLAGMLGAERLIVGRAAAVREPAHDDLVAADDLLAIDPEVLPVVQRPARRREPPGDQRRDVVGPAGLDRPVARGRRPSPSIDDFLARRVAHGFRRHVQDFFEQRQRPPRFADAARRLRRAQRGEQPAELRQRLAAVVADAPPRRAPRCRTDSLSTRMPRALAFVNSSAGPRFASTRREISVISSSGLTGASIVLSSPRALEMRQELAQILERRAAV